MYGDEVRKKLITRNKSMILKPPSNDVKLCFLILRPLNFAELIVLNIKSEVAKRN